MCGITGGIFFGSERAQERFGRSLVEDALQRIRHRGPDEQGVYEDPQAGVLLGACRLSILDLTQGYQPIENEDGSCVVAFNGEIYNYPELRHQLLQKGHSFKTHCDTEVILHTYEEFSEKCVHHLDGMFAFCLYDKKRKQLFLARDRAGKKPLYYALTDQAFLFGSELKALLAYPSLSKKISLPAFLSYLLLGYVMDPFSIIEGIQKLEAGSSLTFSLASHHVTTQKYWSFCTQPTSSITERDALTELNGLLKRAVHKRLLSDVEVGAFLSGGLDSTTVVSYMTRLSSERIKTFSIGFEDPSFDESRYARRVAEDFHTEHHQELFRTQTLLDLLPQVMAFLDEPFADPSILPTYLLSRFARQWVKVALSGDGGDEIFLGYPSFQGHLLSKPLDFFPSSTKNALYKLSHLLPISFKNFSVDFTIKQFLRGTLIPQEQRHLVWTGAFAPWELSALLLPHVLAQAPDPSSLIPSLETLGTGGEMNKIIAFYFVYYLGQQVLVKVDRASMAASLEVRSPLLDKDLVEYAKRLPWTLKLKYGRLKYLLKKVMQESIPDEILHRPKKGFGIPIARWLSQELHPMLQELLNESDLKKQGLFSPAYVQRLIHEHHSRIKNHAKPLWTLFMFQHWYRTFYLKP